MEIKVAGHSEIPVLKDLAEKIWWPTYREILSEAQIAFMLKDMYSESALQTQMDSGSVFLISYRDKQPVAFAGYGITDRSLKIHKLYVLPSEQGKGTGKQLITHLTDLALNDHCDRMELNVNRANPALGFYQGMGFEIQKSVDIPYHGFVLDDYVMQKLLNTDV